MTQRGDVVVATFPYVSGGASKNRPAVVVQCDRLNRQMRNTVVAMVPGNFRLVSREPSQFLIDPAAPEGRSAGLMFPSAVQCENPMTIDQNVILRTLGHLSDALKQRLKDQVEGYARRKGMPVAEVERWLAPSLAYEVEEESGGPESWQQVLHRRSISS
jgi:mRNA-degrading endonuclease toxin of MazEF toxin-antitoxin module